MVTGKVDGHALVTVTGGHNLLANEKTDRGLVADDLPVEHIQMGLRRAPEVQKAFDTLVDQLHTRVSANYHKWLTPEEIGRNFGPAQSDIAQLTAWLQSQGFRVNFVMQSGMVVDFSGDAGLVREAFHTEIHNIELHDGRRFVAAMSEAQIPAAFKELVGGFPSLSSMPPTPMVKMQGTVRFNPKTRGVKSLTDMQGNTTVNPNPDFSFICPGAICGTATNYYAVGPQDFYIIYNENALLNASTPINGSGQTVAVLEESDINTADVTTFRTAFGVTPTTPSLTVEHGHGAIACNDPGKLDTATDEEEWVADVDAEWAGAAAPAATVLFESCQTTSSTQGVLLAAEAVVDNNLAVSTSLSHELAEPLMGSSNPTWGAESLWTNLWEQAAAQGITAVVAAGDTGIASEDAYLNDSHLNNPYSYYGANVNGLGATAYNVSAGGTDFQDGYNYDDGITAYGPSLFWTIGNSPNYSSAKSYPPETAWNGTCAGSLDAYLNNYSGNNLAGFCGADYAYAPGIVAGGGGPSATIAQPSWQSGVYGVSLNNTTGKRGTPDVSMFASNAWWGHNTMFCDSDAYAGNNSSTAYPCTYTNTTDASEQTAGGTAFAAAELAGIFALVAQKTGERQGQADYVLYAMAANQYGSMSYKSGCNGSGAIVNSGTTSGLYFPPASTCVFNDIVTGNIDVPCEHSGTHALSTCYVNSGKTYGVVSTSATTLSPIYQSTEGWDFATGLGSVNIANLVNGWIGGTYSASFTATVSLADATLSGASWTYGNPIAPSNLVTTVTGTGSLPTGTVTDAAAPTVGTIGSGTFPATGCSTLNGTGTGSGTCQSSNSVTVAYAPSATLPPASYTVTSTYSTVNENYRTGANGTLSFTVTAGPTTAAMVSPVSSSPVSQTYGALSAFTVSGTLSWTGSGTAPAASDVTFTSTAGGSVGAVTCSGTTSPYSCSATFTPSASDAVGSYSVNLSFAGDGNYSAGASTQAGNFKITAATPTVAITPSPAQTTVGSTAAIGLTVTVTGTGVSGDTAPITTPSMSATTGTFSTPSCSTTGTTETCTVNYTPSGGLAGNTYTGYLAASVAAGGNYTSASGSDNLVVNKGVVSFGTMSFTPATSEPYGTSQAITISDTLSYGGGTKPTGAVTYVLNSVSYPANCTGSSSPLSCTAAVPAGTIAALAVNAYTVTAGYAADSNFGAATGASGTFTITQNATTTTVSAAPNSIGPGSSSTVTATVADTGAGATPAGSVTFTDTTNSAPLGSCTLSGGSCSIAVAGTSLAAGSNSIQGVYGASPIADWATSNGTTTLTLVAAPTTTISLAPSAAGSTTTGVNSTTLTASITAASVDGSWGGTVTFTNTMTHATYVQAVTGAGTAGSASVTIAEPDSGTAAGLNNYTATYSGSMDYQASGPSSAVSVYWQGLLVSLTANHDFSGLISYGSAPISVEGTVDGTKLGPYGVTVYNFSTAAQTVGLTFVNSASGAFSYATNCPASLAAGAICNYAFYYTPPNGDGCNPTVNCTEDSSHYPQGTYEAGTWSVTSGATLGVGLKGFAAPVRSGSVTFPATLSGKAVLPQNTPVSVSPLGYSFGPLAPGELSNTLTVTVTNTSSSSVALSYEPPVTTPFQAADYCPASLAGNSTCTINVTFQSTTMGTLTDSVVIKPAGGAAIAVTLTGIVNANNGLQLNTNAHNFGNVAMGTSAAAFGLSITNNATSSATLHFSGSQSGTTPYSMVSSGCPASLAAGAQCSVVVNFTPAAVGTFNDVVTITSDVPILPNGTGGSGNYSGTVSFTGAGVTSGQFTASSMAHNWGDVTVGTTATNYGVQLTNTTATALTLTLGNGYTQGLYGFNEAGTNCGATLAVNGSCELIFSFSPTGAGSVSASFGVTAVDTSNNPVQLMSGGTAYTAVGLMGNGQ
jgi:subtilase family serine protease